MKRCTIAGASLRRDTSAARRWLSYDKSALTREELTRQVQAGLEETIRIDAEAKTIATAAGKELPMSPLFDPDWIKTRRRERKPDAGHMSGRFRKKLALNPYGTNPRTISSRSDLP